MKLYFSLLVRLTQHFYFMCVQFTKTIVCSLQKLSATGHKVTDLWWQNVELPRR